METNGADQELSSAARASGFRLPSNTQSDQVRSESINLNSAKRSGITRSKIRNLTRGATFSEYEISLFLEGLSIVEILRRRVAYLGGIRAQMMSAEHEEKVRKEPQLKPQEYLNKLHQERDSVLERQYREYEAYLDRVKCVPSNHLGSDSRLMVEDAFCTSCFKRQPISYFYEQSSRGGAILDSPGNFDLLVPLTSNKRVSVCRICGNKVFTESDRREIATAERAQKTVILVALATVIVAVLFVMLFIL